MADLLTILFTALLLAWLADIKYKNRPAEIRHRSVFFTVCLVILMAGYIGLRTHCNDTTAYTWAYELITDGYLDNLDKSPGSNPLFNIINYCLRMAGVSTQNFLMFWAFLTLICYLVFLYRYSVDFPLTVFLIFSAGGYLFAAAGIKQAAAVGISMIGVMFALKHKWVPYIICVIIATFIHPYSLLFLLVPILRFRPWSYGSYILVFGAIIGGILLRPLLGTIVDITTMLGEEYTVDSFSGDGVNIFRVLVCNVPTVLSWLYRDKIFKNSTESDNLIMNLTMLNGAIMFVGIFGTANYFARLANYFILFQSLSLPWLMKKIGGRDGKILTIFMLIGYSAYFYYAYAINQPWGQYFSRLTLAEYFAQLGG